MRNISSALLWIAFIYFIYKTGFQWIYIMLPILGLVLWEWPVKENKDLLLSQIERTKAETENIKWVTKLNQSTVQLNIKSFELMSRGPR
jgi:hypothetical protein